MSRRASLVAAIPRHDGFAVPVVVHLRWAEPEHTEGEGWSQSLLLRHPTDDDAEEILVGEFSGVPFRWVLAWEWVARRIRMKVEQQMMQMLESGELLADDNEEDEQ